MFKDLRDVADDIFCNLPPPQPKWKNSVPSSRSYNHASTPATSASSNYQQQQYTPPSPATFSMAMYNNASAGCFHGMCEVTMSNGITKRVQDVLPGDEVRCSNDPLSKCSGTIECVVKTVSSSGFMDLVTIEGGLLLTPYHPMRLNDAWTFPIDVANSQRISCDAVYTFLLSREVDCDGESVEVNGSLGCSGRPTSVVINGIECITFAHGIENDTVASHEFFGTEAITESLRKQVGWDNGYVVIKQGSFVRDDVTGLICGISASKQQH